MVDLTRGLDTHTPRFAGYPPVSVQILSAIGNEGAPGERAVNSSHIAFGLHCGTHMDAPYHFIHNGRTIDQVALAQCAGPALLLDMRHKRPNDEIRRPDLEPFEPQLRETGRVVFHTGWYHRWGLGEFFDDFPVLTGDAARFLVGCGILLVGLDTPSLDRTPFEAHQALLGSGAVIIENLTNLDAIRCNPFHLIALPLSLTGREASPVRAIAAEW
jgi:kynurenine formamidase